jgi:hypothetical protein
MPAGKLDNAWQSGLAALLAATALVTAAGCGGTASTQPHAAGSSGYVKEDGDEDSDDQRPPVMVGADEQPLLTTYGGNASPADARAITALVKNYYTASAAGDAARACSLLYASLAGGLAAQQSQAVPGARATCTEPMSALLGQQRARLAAEDASTMAVTAVHVKGDLGLAVLGFRRTPASQIVVEREGRTWKIDALVATYMP